MALAAASKNSSARYFVVFAATRVVTCRDRVRLKTFGSPASFERGREKKEIGGGAGSSSPSFLMHSGSSWRPLPVARASFRLFGRALFQSRELLIIVYYTILILLVQLSLCESD